MALTDLLVDIADSIREKTDKTDGLKLYEMPDAIRSIETGSTDVPFRYGGLNAELVYTTSDNWDLDDTSFIVGSSASTSATSIKASTSNAYVTPSLLIGNRDVVVVQKWIGIPGYFDESDPKSRANATAGVYTTYFTKRQPNMSNKSNLTTRNAANLTTNFIDYLNASGARALGNASYGFYCSPVAPTVSSATANSATVRISTPALYYRASTTYMSAANCKRVGACMWSWKTEVYLCDGWTVPQNVVEAVNILYERNL